MPLVYDELRKLAAAKLADEKPGQTLQPTALVHEAYLRLVEVKKAQQVHLALRPALLRPDGGGHRRALRMVPSAAAIPRASEYQMKNRS